jgi:glucose uptake protein GlcU
MTWLFIMIGLCCVIAGIGGTYALSGQEHWQSVCIMLYGIVLLVCSTFIRRIK